jgi:hypothetical protein
VLPLASAYALAVASLLFVSYVVNGFILLPILQGTVSAPSDFSTFGGVTVVYGRLFSWLGPAEQTLSVVILIACALLARRFRGPTAAEAEAECPWCRSPIPLAAAVCRACRREVTR